MTETPKTKSLWTAAENAATPEAKLRHPWNPNSEVYLKRLSMGAGLKRSVLTIARVPPGKESFVFHSHERDEEFLYILSGRGRAEIGDSVAEVGPGDFMGFTAPGVAHYLVNPYSEDLVYLMGRERSGMDIGYFPKLGRRIVFTESSIGTVEDRAVRPMTYADWIAKS